MLRAEHVSHFFLFDWCELGKRLNRDEIHINHLNTLKDEP